MHAMADERAEKEQQHCPENSEPSRIVVLTFDDGSKTNLNFVAPLLKELGFGATFFVTHQWMHDTVNFLNWIEIAELHQMGFEIGNHSWSHSIFAQPKAAAALAGELGLVEWELRKVGVPRPVSFAYCASGFGPEAVEVLKEQGYKYGRRGTEPEMSTGNLKFGPAYDPGKHHPLLIPTAIVSTPEISLNDFREALNSVKPGEIAVIMYHGVPDIPHPWANTSPTR